MAWGGRWETWGPQTLSDRWAGRVACHASNERAQRAPRALQQRACAWSDADPAGTQGGGALSGAGSRRGSSSPSGPRASRFRTSAARRWRRRPRAATSRTWWAGPRCPWGSPAPCSWTGPTARGRSSCRSRRPRGPWWLPRRAAWAWCGRAAGVRARVTRDELSQHPMLVYEGIEPALAAAKVAAESLERFQGLVALDHHPRPTGAGRARGPGTQARPAAALHDRGCDRHQHGRARGRAVLRRSRGAHRGGGAPRPRPGRGEAGQRAGPRGGARSQRGRRGDREPHPARREGADHAGGHGPGDAYLRGRLRPPRDSELDDSVRQHPGGALSLPAGRTWPTSPNARPGSSTWT